MTETKTFPAALLKQNHERTAKAVQRLNEKAWAGIKYEAELEEGKLGVIVKYAKPGIGVDAHKQPYKETFRYTTRLEQTIGWPVNYTYRSGNAGTMCQGIYDAERTRQNKVDGLHSMERQVEKLRAELEQAEAAVAARKAELGY